jgi:hypothetical protein
MYQAILTNEGYVDAIGFGDNVFQGLQDGLTMVVLSEEDVNLINDVPENNYPKYENGQVVITQIPPGQIPTITIQE